MSTSIINSVDVDSEGNYWLGLSSGLYKWFPKTKISEHLIPERIKSVSAVIVDSKKSVWIGSGLSLYRYNITHNQLFAYGKSDGIVPNEILPKSRLLTKNGDVYIGGVAGFSRIESRIPFPEQIKPSFELLDIQLDGSLLSSDRQKIKNGYSQIRLPWNHTSLQLNLFINTPSLSTFPRCRYIIEGLNTNFQVLETQTISTQTLPSGNYKVLIEYELKDEHWSEPFYLVEIKVMPPWWQTWWFYLLMVVIIAGILFRYRQIAVRKTKQLMELEMQKHERDLSEQKIRFLINISHELRTPLTLVYAPLRRLLKDENTPVMFKPLLTLMYKHVKNMKNMIDMVLDVRKMETKQETLQLSPQKVNEWIMEIVEDFIFEFQTKNIELSTELDSSIQTINFDRQRCDKVLSNLLMNAIKFSDENSKIIVRSKWLDNKIKISVIDEGPGVSDNDVPNLFGRFFQTNHQKGGSGIGLSYSKTQVELHGGSIGYQPAKPKGSEFWFELPANSNLIVSENTYEQIMLEKKDSETIQNIVFAENVDFKLLSVLIVEDEPDLLTYMEDSMKEVFRTVLTAKQGDEALQKIFNEKPDLVISDVMMPVMDGFELCKLIKTNIEISHIPVVLLTALGDDDSSLTGYKMGADLYLPKPFGVDILMAILANLFRSRIELKKRYAQAEVNINVQEIAHSNADEKFMSKLILLIEEKMDDSELRIDFLAVEMAMSRTSFYNKVKAITGLSANNFILDYKTKKAIQLLKNTNLPIQEIAMQLGFVNQRYFSTVFKQMTGKTPTQYRTKT